MSQRTGINECKGDKSTSQRSSKLKRSSHLTNTWERAAGQPLFRPGHPSEAGTLPLPCSVGKLTELACLKLYKRCEGEGRATCPVTLGLSQALSLQEEPGQRGTTLGQRDECAGSGVSASPGPPWVVSAVLDFKEYREHRRGKKVKELPLLCGSRAAEERTTWQVLGQQMALADGEVRMLLTATFPPSPARAWKSWRWSSSWQRGE